MGGFVHNGTRAWCERSISLNSIFGLEPKLWRTKFDDDGEVLLHSSTILPLDLHLILCCGTLEEAAKFIFYDCETPPEIGDRRRAASI
jgi:hypothetical protein